MTTESTEEDALVAFFEALGPAARLEYAALAELDRRFGEHVAAERDAHGEPENPANAPKATKE